MRRLILLTYNLTADADADVYAAFMREVDYPMFRQFPEVLDYRAFRIVEEVQGQRSFRYFDLLEVAEFADMEQLFARPELAVHAARWIERWSEFGPDGQPEQNFGIALCEEI